MFINLLVKWKIENKTKIKIQTKRNLHINVMFVVLVNVYCSGILVLRFSFSFAVYKLLISTHADFIFRFCSICISKRKNTAAYLPMTISCTRLSVYTLFIINISQAFQNTECPLNFLATILQCLREVCSISWIV